MTRLLSAVWICFWSRRAARRRGLMANDYGGTGAVWEWSKEQRKPYDDSLVYISIHYPWVRRVLYQRLRII